MIFDDFCIVRGWGRMTCMSLGILGLGGWNFPRAVHFFHDLVFRIFLLAKSLVVDG